PILARPRAAIGVILAMLPGSSPRSHLIPSEEIDVEHENDREARDRETSQGGTRVASRSPSSPHASADAGTREEPQDLPPAPTTLSVIVSDLSRQPLARARVTILRAPGATYRNESERPVPASNREVARAVSLDANRSRTDGVVTVGETSDDGRIAFSIDALPHGSLRILAEMPGYAADSVVWSRSEATAEIALRLRPGHAIAGVVVDPIGQPVAGARVEAMVGEGLASELDVGARTARRGGVTGLV